MIYITEILLKDFRNHREYRNFFDRNHVLFFGQNGAGKTNLLEAISKLSPGNGIKSARNQDIARDQKFPWELNIKFSSSESDLKSIGISFDFKKKIVKANDEVIKRSSELIDHVKLVWFVPQMNNIFIDEKSYRQKFFDRIITNFYKDHLANLIIYEKLKKERKKLLYTTSQERWMEIIEERLAICCCEITNKRIAGVQILQEKINSGSFVKPEIQIDCKIKNLISDDNCIERIKDKFKACREIDKITGKTTFGAHLADFYAMHPKNRSNLCSTGEQKSIILSILLACSKSCDFILLDDISSHMDGENFDLFLDEVLKQGCQLFFADINIEKFLPYKEKIQFIELSTNTC